MYFKDNLKKATLVAVDVVDAMIANDVECVFGNQMELTDNQFEFICSLVQDVYISYENIYIEQIVRAIYGLLDDNGIGYLDEIDTSEIAYRC
jgi:hypothetical protein